MDVLLVVEDAWHSDLRARYPSWLGSLDERIAGQELDVHVGLITLDPYGQTTSGMLQSGEGYRWLNQGTPDLDAALRDLGTVTTLGSSLQSGRDVIYEALGPLSAPTGFNEGFLRPEADLSVIVVSDLPDYSTGTGFDAWLGGLKSDPYQVTVSCITSGTFPDYGLLADAYGGVQVSSMTPDWTGVWSASDSRDPVSLGLLHPSQAPALSSLEVHVVEESGALVPLVEGADFVWLADDEAVYVEEDARPAFPATYRLVYTPEVR